ELPKLPDDKVLIRSRSNCPKGKVWNGFDCKSPFAFS
nr:Chain A, scarabaecin [synthetic construct]